LIVGGPLFGLEPGYERELKVQARDAGLDGRVVFTGFRADVPALLAASDVVVVPSITPEGFGMATLEGMAAGRPVVATGIGATPELITDDVSGMLVPPNDPEKLAEVLMRLIDNQQHRERLGTCARRTALERFSLPPVVRAYEDVYSSAIQRRSTGASRHNREAPSSLRGERIVDEVHDAHYYRHLRRYLFARQYTAGCRAVLDAGCGSGYGTRLLAEDAEQVIGCDYDPDAVAYSSDHFRKPNLRFAVADSRALAFRSAMFDTVVSLEVFEHVVEWQQFLTEARRVLKPEGIFVLSTPNRLTTRLQEKKTGQRHYEYHVGEVTPKELESRLRGFFRHVEVFAMRRNGNALYAWLRRMDVLNLRFKLPQRMRHQLSRDMGVSWDPRGVVSPDDFVIEKSQWRQALSIVAVCRL
jgi:2-polyprenyl-3-methyl-5-hydroxy-6-metoxy-1,4-benzoquinol methylase